VNKILLLFPFLINLI